MINNIQFLQAIFGDSYIYSHVTSFKQDPGNIPNDERARCWAGGYFKDTPLIPNSNQFYTVSLFSPDETGRSRRRKIQFSGTYVIGLDDVREKLPIEQVERLPPPSIILKSSLHSEQWLYILNQPECDRNRIDNLHDGLINNGLAPNSKDPGQKGVTRYLRLPEGCNTKAKRITENDGTPPRCEIIEFQPNRRYTLEELASPFQVDLNAPRRDSRTSGASEISDHPLINIPKIIHIKSTLSDGRFDITCPWVDDHTDQDDSGSAVFTNDDRTIGFKCHHGTCQDRTGKDLLEFIEEMEPGFSSKLKNWQVIKQFNDQPEISFMATNQPEISFIANQEDDSVESLQLICDKLRQQLPGSSEQREYAAKVLKVTEDLPKIDQKHWHDVVNDIMRWSKIDFKDIINDLRKTWYGEKISKADFYDNVVFVKELNQFYDWDSRIFFSTDAFQNSFSHEDAEARKIALQDGRVQKVDRLDYAPRNPRIFIENGCRYANTWSDVTQSTGIQGDVSRWTQHFDVLGWSSQRDHIEKWLAFTLRHPEKKINHILLLGSGEGCGKDFLLYPLIKAMGENSTVISGEELLEGFNDYILSTKYLHVNEAELGDRREALAVSNKLKPLAAAPPDTLSVNQKSIKRIKVRNILNATMTTNSVMPFRLNGPSRRFFGVWSDLNPRDKNDNMKKEWLDYWEDRWNWMKADGWRNVAWHLMNAVDLTNFNHNEAPPMTEFLRDIKESSKSPMQQTIESFIKNRHGAFKCDILTTSDMGEILRLNVMAPADMMTDPRFFSDKKVGTILRESGIYKQVRCSNARLWIIRNLEKYEGFTSGELYREYERQLKSFRGEHPLTVVKNDFRL